MNEIVQRLELLADKIREIIRTNKLLNEENKHLREQLRFLQQKLENQEEMRSTKQEEIIISTTAKPLYLGDKEEAARKKIDDLVRELDFCLTLLDS